MTGAAAILVCALDLLGRSERTFPPIHLVASPPADVSPNADAFVRSETEAIYLITSSAAFRDARCGDRRSLAKLASIIVHEEWHVRHGSDERGAYQAQLMALSIMGVGPGTSAYHSVQRSMAAVLNTPPRPVAPPRPLVALLAFVPPMGVH